MLGFITENLGTIIVGGIVLVVVATIVFKMIRDRKKGGCSSCDGCSGSCPYSAGCPTSDQDGTK